MWVYDRTESLLVGILMHASLTASTLFVLASTVEGAPLFLYYLVLALLLCLMVAAIVACRKKRSGSGKAMKR